jgi:hypothetical protein
MPSCRCSTQRVPFAALALLVACAGAVRAEEPLHQRIDRLIAAGQPGYDKLAAPTAPDAEFLRRAATDLTGTIPTAEAARAFLADADPARRAKLIDQLLASHGYARRMAQFFDVMLMERRADAKVPRAGWEDYLRESFAANKPYDALVREILSADGTDAKTRPAAKFLLDRDLEPNLVTRDIARVFLGKNFQCAQCHDHPLVEDYKQQDYYGILAFLNRSFLFPNPAAPAAVIAEKADGDVTFVSVFDKAKKQFSTGPRVPGGKPVAETPPEKGKEYTVAPAKDVRPVPAYSRRALLAGAITAPENTAFARTAVNRLWAMMLGRGLVHPVDMDHAANPPSHPELLDLLAKEFVDHHYDVKWLLREIALSRTYQLGSELPPGAPDAPPDKFLCAALKPLTPEQLAYAVMQATGFTEAERAALGPKVTDAALDAKIAPRVAPFRSVFAARPGTPEDGFLATLDQTLFLKYGQAVRGLTAPRPGNLLDRLAKLSDPNAAADELFLSVLTRLPTADERRDVAAAIAGAKDRPAALGELVWALVASDEFRFCH